MKDNVSLAKFEETGCAVVTYPAELATAVTKTAKSWEAFTALPSTVKSGLPYSNGGAGTGYEEKKGVGKNADRKENFDVTSGTAQWLSENASAFHNETARNFVKNAAALIPIVKPTIMAFAEAIEAKYGIEGFAEEVDRSENRFFVRFIHYMGDRQEGEETAAAHVDQSGFTLHLHESDEGFEILPYNKSGWQRVSFGEGKTLIIPSMQLQLRSKGQLKALAHRVTATKHTAKKGRFSAVLFVQLANTRKYDKDTRGLLRDKAPGFNYDMPYGEFSQLFA